MAGEEGRFMMRFVLEVFEDLEEFGDGIVGVVVVGHLIVNIYYCWNTIFGKIYIGEIRIWSKN